MKQSDALSILKTGNNVFLTGQAGAGKTYVLNAYIRYLHTLGIPVAITASTGIAATHINGMTLHSWSGIGIKDRFTKEDFIKLAGKGKVVERIKSAKVLIIDEISMLHAKQVDLINEILQYFLKNDQPFGGIQVVFAGDFFQLPPIGDKDETTRDKFAFMSKIWIDMATSDPKQIHVCYLSEQHRQTDETELTQYGMQLIDILNQIRTQSVSPQAHEILTRTNTQAIGDNRTRLYTHNINVNTINQSELDALTTQAHTYEAKTTGDQNLITQLQKNVRAPQTLVLKKGAKVMFVKNNPLNETYNGTMGMVIGFSDVGDEGVLPVVQLNSGESLIVSRDVWTIENEKGEDLASYYQIPLCLAWAITVHKSQGMSLDAAEIDLTKTFEVGQGYVALSRLKSLSGLKLLGLNDKSLRLDDFAIVANQRFLALSDESQAWLDQLTDDELNQLHTSFIRQSRPSLTDNAIHKLLSAPFEQQDITASTRPTSDDSTQIHAQISQLIHDQTPLKSIASAVGLSVSSVIDRLSLLIIEDELTAQELAYLHTSDDLQALERAFVALYATDFTDYDAEHDDFDPAINDLYDELRGAISRNDIRLMLVRMGVL